MNVDALIKQKCHVSDISIPNPALQWDIDGPDFILSIKTLRNIQK